ncbi:hypothetical protein ACS5PU_17940 [Pedobacter sp. GSP4]|uniref:hypothetical protein n=1 Tax=Pedobacter sp. GSP4 TaxID=3453716 RepID=UPI003EED68D5
MIELSYTFEQEFLGNTAYQLMRAEMDAPWLVLSGPHVVGIIDKSGDSWVQIAGEAIPNAAVKGMGELIAKQQFSWLPNLIKKQWPDDVKEVVVENEGAYNVVCYKDICPKRFQLKFTPGIYALAKREAEIVFNVCRYNIAGQFKVIKTPTADRYAS